MIHVDVTAPVLPVVQRRCTVYHHTTARATSMHMPLDTLLLLPAGLL